MLLYGNKVGNRLHCLVDADTMTSLSMSLRQPAFVRWSVYTEECLDMLSAEPPALPGDIWLCDLIRIQRIAEAASVAFAMDDPGAIITLRDVRTQYQLRGFRQQVDYWRRHARSNLVLRKCSPKFLVIPLVGG